MSEIGDMVNWECASGTAEALNYLNRADPLPDLIFLDLNMPGYDGKKCLGHLKAADRLQHIPVIIYSTFISQADREEMLELGANNVIIKPGAFNSIQLAILNSMQAINHTYR